MTTNLNRRLVRYTPAALSLFRLVYGLLFAGYGSMILFGWPVRPAWPVQVGSWPGWYAGLIELVTGLLIATGLFTRAAAFIASGEMAVAYVWMHQPRSLWPIGDPPGGQWWNFGDSLLLRFLSAGLHRRGELFDRRATRATPWANRARDPRRRMTMNADPRCDGMVARVTGSSRGLRLSQSSCRW